MVSAYEQRNSRRTPISWPVSIWHPQAARFFNGKSINVSNAGALVILPLEAPILEGQNLEINFPRSHRLAEEKGSCARIKSCRVIRVDREAAMTEGALRVGIAFETAPEPACV